MQEQELFQQYELKGWQLSPYLYKIIGASALINLVMFALMAQANFLTGKTCDSPIASGVCSVLDALYVGSNVSGVDYVDKGYDKTEITSNDEIIMVNLDGEYPPLTYPEGYFALANPDQQPEVTNVFDPNTSTIDIPGISGNPNITTPDLTKITPNYPTPNNKAVTDLPTGIFDTDSPNIKKPIRNGSKNRPNSTDTANGKTTAENKTNKTETTETPANNETVQEIEINKRVMQDFGNMVKAKVDKKEVDLTQPFKVIVEGTLTKDGKLDLSIDKRTKKAKSQFVFEEGDPQMIEVAKEALEAVGDSGWLGYLKNSGADNVKITLVQDQDKFFAIVESDQKTPEKAQIMASGINMLINLTRKNVKLGEDETILINGAQKPTSNGKFFRLDFALPKQTVQDMIKRNLDKAAEAEKNKQNSTAQTDSANQKTSK